MVTTALLQHFLIQIDIVVRFLSVAPQSVTRFFTVATALHGLTYQIPLLRICQAAEQMK
jgi:hypothetical protein